MQSPARFILAICVLLALGSPTQTASQPPQKLEGEVLDKDSNAIPGVLVRLYRGSTKIGDMRTGPDGRYSIPFPSGGPISSVRYDHSEWNPAVINDVSGVRDHRINKVLYKIGSVLSLLEADAALSSLTRVYHIDRANAVPTSQIKQRYGAVVREMQLPRETYNALKTKVDATAVLYEVSPKLLN